MNKTTIVLIILVGGIIACNVRLADEEYGSADHKNLPTISEIAAEVDPSTFSTLAAPELDFFPCMDCHADQEVNTQRRELVDMHENIIFEHDSKHRWCLACHDATNRDSLRLASGINIDFANSYKLCGQCHGPKYRDWKLGIHGKRTGDWNGDKQYRLCVHCHDPHSPKFKPIEPMPPPLLPGDLKTDSLN
ncbi:hypothetical protein ACFLSI_06930 [Bacteroidota bacterium]